MATGVSANQPYNLKNASARREKRATQTLLTMV